MYAHGHPATNGHFAQRPIIPGVVILADVLHAIRARAATLPNAQALKGTSAYQLRAAKFLQPVLPGQQMEILLKTPQADDAQSAAISIVHFECSVSGKAVAKGTFEFHRHDV
jgi:3-hydroxymyristoyl/3-hydroxydecanoyl-(acyl carrier protein) dehydratase